MRDGLRVSRRWLVAFCALEQLGAYADASGNEWVRSGTWVKPNGTPQLTGDRPAQGSEGLAFAKAGGRGILEWHEVMRRIDESLEEQPEGLAVMHRKGKKTWKGGGRRGTWVHNVVKGGAHPNEKPLALMLELVEVFTDPGDLIFDPFCGVGTTGVAALMLGRRFFGVERDPEWAEVARKRLATVAADAAAKEISTHA